MLRNVVTVSCIWLVGSAIVDDARADIVAANYLGGGSELSNDQDGFVAGWGFTPTVEIQLTGLGLYDLDRGGLNEDHRIGVFRVSDGVNLAVGSVPAGSGTTLIPGTEGGSRMDSTLFDVSLSAGEKYYIVAEYTKNTSPDDIVYGDTAVSFASEFTWDGYIGNFGTASIFDPMVVAAGQNGALGPTFTYTQTVPEPTSLGVFAFGLLWSIFRRSSNRIRKMSSRATQIF